MKEMAILTFHLRQWRFRLQNEDDLPQAWRVFHHRIPRFPTQTDKKIL